MPPNTKNLDVEKVAAAVEEAYAACLPWVREEAAIESAADREAASCAQDRVKSLVDAVEASAAVTEGSPGSNMAQAELTVDDPVRERDSVNDAGRSFESFEELAAAVKELQVVVSTPLSITSPPGVGTYRSRR